MGSFILSHDEYSPKDDLMNYSRENLCFSYFSLIQQGMFLNILIAINLEYDFQHIHSINSIIYWHKLFSHSTVWCIHMMLKEIFFSVSTAIPPQEL